MQKKLLQFRDVSPWPGLKDYKCRPRPYGFGLVIKALALTLNQLNPATQ